MLRGVIQRRQVNLNSLRHARDYIVLRDFEKILENLSVQFAAVKPTKARHLDLSEIF